jgi:DNA-binding FadR family transcriptional regulator
MEKPAGPNKKRFEIVAGQIVDLIRGENLEKGARLPIEPELAMRFQVSRATIREAMKYLSAEGIVLVQQGRGTFVNSATGIRDDPLGIESLEKRMRLDQLLEARLLLEPQIAMSAAQRAAKADIEELRKLVEQLDTVDINDIASMSIDIAFHESVARCTHNEILSRIVPVICESVKRTQRLLTDKDIGLKKAKTAHRHIFCAIEAHDAISARYNMEKHIQETIQFIHISVDEA